MLSTSPPPLSLPGDSKTRAPTKRPQLHNHDHPTPKPRLTGPFIDDDDDDSEEDEHNGSAHLPKKRMLDFPPNEPSSCTTSLTNGNELEVTLIDSNTATQLDSNPKLAPISSIWSTQLPPLFGASAGSLFRSSGPKYTIQTCNGQTTPLKERKKSAAVSYASMVEARSKTKEGRAKRSFYGIDIHTLMSNAKTELQLKKTVAATEQITLMDSVETPQESTIPIPQTRLWTEKYRAKKFIDLCGDDGTNRSVLRWLKRWDPIVFPNSSRSKSNVNKRPGMKQEDEEEKPHRKILLLTGAPGLGKTTLAHVCARQAGYEVIEINASDDRSRDVVKTRIRTSLGTQSVKNVSNRTHENGSRRMAKPVCVVVDEVDGVVTGSGGSGEGGFVKALMDLVVADQSNSTISENGSGFKHNNKKKGDDFRLLRPIILICNDVYHPSLRPLRQSSMAEVVHAGKPTIDAVIGRLKFVFEREGIPCEKDAARKLCEAAWGMASGIDARKGAGSTVEGDLRGVMVVGEWVAGRFRSSVSANNEKLTRHWIERNILHDLASGAAGSRGMGRGSVKDIISRLFQEGGGFPKQSMDLSVSKMQYELPKTELGFNEQQKKYSMERLRQMVETSGDVSHVVTGVFAEYPNREYNDDCFLSKPNDAYDWLYFHDTCQSRLFTSQEWELAPYLSSPILAWHHLFASPKKHYDASTGHNWRRGGAAVEAEAPLPFSGPRADYEAYEAEKQTRAQLQGMLGQFSPTMARLFRSADDMATEFLPYLVRMVSPDVKPVVIGGSQGSTASVRKESERNMVRRAADVLAEVGITLQRGRIESETMSSRGPQYVYRMDPDLDELCTFETAVNLVSSQAPIRYAIRQVLDQELQRSIAMRENEARQARFKAGGEGSLSVEMNSKMSLLASNDKNKLGATLEVAKAVSAVKKDFFGRVLQVTPLAELEEDARERATREKKKAWVTFHEGLNNAVRKPISLQEFLMPLSSTC